MVDSKFKHLYGPVSSWRLGRSLGVDLLPQGCKTCSFDCVYCQLGQSREYIDQRQVFIDTDEVLAEIKNLPDIPIDYFTFSGQGEPSLAANLGQTAQGIKTLRQEPVAVISNGSFIHEAAFREELAVVDYVSLKLDACNQPMLKKINRPCESIKFEDIIQGMAEFRKIYKGTLALQIMFIEENKNEAENFIDLLKNIKPDEVHLNTPLRPCGVKPLTKEEMKKIKAVFVDLPYKITSVYDVEKMKVEPISEEDTLKRRPNKF
jgi:wyosine [tRNA(Phe)-imidazoG37] synthetase (radical SAM superfamily)